jgi:hypothetical protein
MVTINTVWEKEKGFLRALRACRLASEEFLFGLMEVIIFLIRSFN